MEFLDRVEERRRLNRFLSAMDGALACLYGRRRVGKSRLIEELVKGKSSVVSFVADKSEASLQRERLAKDISIVLPGFADVRYDSWGALLERWVHDAPRGAVLIIDELPYLVERSPELPSVLQRIVDGIRTSGQKIVLCGSSQRMMQGLVLNEREPLYGRAREIIKLDPLAPEWMSKAFPRLSSWERFSLYAVWGGIPRYWEICRDSDGLWGTLREHVFSPQGLFHDEPYFILQDDLRDSVQAASVLALIGEGVTRPSEIAARLRTPATSLGRPLKRLTGLGLVRRDVPFGSDAKSAKKALYRLADPFLRFWYSFVHPNYSDAYYLSDKAEIDAIQPAFAVFLGQAWEFMVRDTVQRKPLPGLDGRLRNAARWWGIGVNGRQMEIDVVAESVDRNVLFVGEAKLSLSEMEAEHAMRELVAKARLLPFADKYKRIEARLFVARNPPRGAVSLDWCGL